MPSILSTNSETHRLPKPVSSTNKSMKSVEQINSSTLAPNMFSLVDGQIKAPKECGVHPRRLCVDQFLHLFGMYLSETM